MRNLNHDTVINAAAGALLLLTSPDGEYKELTAHLELRQSEKITSGM